MAALSQFLTSHYQTNSLSFFYHSTTFHSNYLHYNARHSIVCLASTKKPRPSRKLMSDADLRNGLREFVALVGLPEGHVPSTKQLSEHGRKDLANIVRRRGHKLIKELLTKSAETAMEGCDLPDNPNGKLNGNDVHKETGQNEKVNEIIEESADVPLMNDESASETNLVMKSESATCSDDESPVSIESPVSLQEKVEIFMKYGQLDTVEDDLHGNSKLNDVEDCESTDDEGILARREPVIRDQKNFTYLARLSNNENGHNSTMMLPRPISLTTMEDKVTRDNYLSAQRQPCTDSNKDKDMDIEVSKMETEVEINRLKQMLHQKEFELSRLKEEIEQEKQALSILQTKAEDEISKAQKLIAEKEAELDAAEESLAGLVEAKIQYSGEGDMVEVAGSFNGWHQRIKLDPQPSSVVIDPIGSRKSRLWSTTLWLYPGVYEVKYIVDGQWKIDHHRETTIRGGIENNIIRVDR